MNITWANSIGWIVLLSAAWMLTARTLGWDNANWFEAAAFGLIVYLCIRSTK